MTTSFVTIEAAIEDLRQGKPIILVDDKDRENEGDLVFAAEFVTPQTVNFMMKHCRGVVCLALSGEYLDRLNIPLQTQHDSKYRPAFTLSIEATEGVTTGVSAFDRAHTIAVAIDPKSQPSDLVTPGHVFPLRARDGGVLVRSGHTEGSVDLAKLAGLQPAAVICEIINDDGTMARVPELEVFAKEHNINIANINDIITHRMQQECLIQETASSHIPIEPHGEFTIKVFENTLDQTQHVALIRGDIDPEEPCLVRVHSECLTGDVFGSTRCDCGWQLQSAIAQIGEKGGVLIYMEQEGRGIGLGNKIKAYALQEQGMDTVEANHHLGFKADHRDYGIGSQILRQLGVRKMRLLTNNPRKIHGLDAYDLEIVGREPIIMSPTKDNLEYLQTKQIKLGHMLNLNMEKEPCA